MVDKPSLDGPRGKLARAREHLETLYAEMLAFDRTNPFGTQHEIDPKTGDDVWRLVIHHSPPIRLSIIAGDVAHNLRSSLDHLVWQLALTQTSTPYEHSQFPICGSQSAFRSKNTQADIQDLSLAAKAVIESVQPYQQNSTGELLYLLSKINNTDKHRITLGVSARQTGLNLPLWCVDYLDAITGIRNDGDEVLRMRREPNRPDLDEHDMKRFHVMFDLGFNLPDVPERKGSIIANFNEIRRAIDEQLLAKCRGFFR